MDLSYGVNVRYEAVSMSDADTFFNAVANGDLKTMETMLETGHANVNQTDSDGFTALMIAASEGFEEIVKMLLEKGANVNSVTLNRNNNSLFFAAKRGNIAIGKLILERNKKLVNVSNIFGETPLIWSCYSGNYAFFEFLLSMGADIHIMSVNDATCLIGSCLGSEPSRVQFIREIMKQCPKFLDVQDVDGQTALHVAAMNGNVSCVKELLAYNADCTLRDAEGRTPLQQAELSCYPECAEILENKWKELEEKAKAELEDLLRSEGYSEEEVTKRKKSKRSKKKAPTTTANLYHNEYQCDHCNNKKKIQGLRYSCRECDDYDLCQACFGHVQDFHPHKKFLEIPPPKLDVFGNYQEVEGREVEIEEEEEKEEEKEKEEEEEEEEEEEKEEEKEKEELSEVKEEPEKVVKEEGSTLSVAEDTSDWQVVSKKGKQRSMSMSANQEGKQRGNRSSKGDKMNYKQTIQKSLYRSEKKLSAVETAEVERRVKEELIPSEKPKEEHSLASAKQNEKQESLPADQEVASIPISTANHIEPTGVSALQAPEPTSSLESSFLPPVGSSITELLNASQPYPSMDYSSMQLPTLLSQDTSLPSFSSYSYYDYPPSSSWLPNRGYSTWKEREIGLERESWRFDGAIGFNSLEMSLPPYQNHYTLDELQKNLELSTPSAKASGIQISQYLGMDLDYASDKQLSLLMDMHMEAIKQISSMKVRLAKNYERQRVYYNKDELDYSNHGELH